MKQLLQIRKLYGREGRQVPFTAMVSLDQKRFSAQSQTLSVSVPVSPLL